MNDEVPSHEQHRREAPASLGIAVITVSDTRDLETDRSGALIVEYLEAAGHRLTSRGIVPDEPAAIEAAALAALPGCDVLILTGGTGLSPRDRTVEVVESLCERPLPGYGELFRMLSWEEIGAAAMLSRACAGVREGRLLVATPGSPGAVRLAMEKLLLPEMGHVIRELGKREVAGG
jgi:molybdenum cofactor biosynthesis protein B